MEFFEAVNKRHSYKQPFQDTAVPLEHLRMIADAGLKAPTGRNFQCVHLVILEDKEAMKPVVEVVAGRNLDSAPAGIAVFTDNTQMTETVDFEIEDYSAAAMSMQLAATALGYSTLWFDSAYKKPENQQGVCKALGVPESFTMRVMMPIGLPAEECERRDKKGFWERVSLNRYGKTGE